jgi:GAF domain-containing protein
VSEPLSEALASIIATIEALSTSDVIGSVLLLDADGSHLRHGAAPGLPAEYVDAIDGSEIGPAAGSCGTAAYRREAVIVDDIERDPLWADYRHLAAAANLRACWSTPIFSTGGELLGTFAMYYRERRAPTADDLSLISLFVRTVAATIEHARSDAALGATLADLERTYDDLQFVLDVTTDVAGILDADAVLDVLVRKAVPRLADSCIVDVLENGSLRRAATATATTTASDQPAADPALAAYTPPSDGRHPIAVAASGKTIEGSDFVAAVVESGAEDVRHLEHLDASAYVCIPLRAGTTTLGVLTLLASGRPGGFEAADIDLANDLAGRVAVVLQSSRLYEATRAAEERLSVLASAGEVLTGSLRVESVVEGLFELTVPRIGDVCEVHLINDDGSVSRFTSGRLPSHTAVKPPAPVEEAMRVRSWRNLDDRDSAVSAVGGEHGHAVSWATVCPLIADAEAVGAITVAGHGAPPGTREVLPLLAGRGALALDNARRLARERSVAETLQRSLLPRTLPEVAGLELAASYHAGARGAEVGGDWYDVIRYRDGRAGLVMGDVMGRGIAAAVVMGALRNSLHAFAIQNHGPGQSLDLLTQVIEADEELLPFATIFFGVFDSELLTLTYASAGHCPALTAGPDGVSYLNEAIDPPVGVPFAGTYSETTVQLQPDTTLVLYTDGLIERRDRDLTDGLTALEHAVRSMLGKGVLTPRAMCHRLVEVLVGDDAEPDDIAVMAVRAT